jgi:hypothetical protein
MKRNLLLLLLIIINKQFCFCQVNEDSAMLTHSETWRVKLNKGLFGLSKPDFGPYTTLEVIKLDSAVTKKKTKDSSYSDFGISGEGSAIDLSKFMTIEKKKFYKLKLIGTSDTIESIFAIASVSHEKKKTFLGTILSKNGESTNDVLDYNRNVQGIIKVSNDLASYIFCIENFTSGGRQTEASLAPVASLSGGYIRMIKTLFICSFILRSLQI